MVVILAAAEIFGTKINRELDFTILPTLPDLKNRAVSVFNDELATRKRVGQPAMHFNLHYLQIFDPATGRWHELKSSTQLRDFCQVYFFQKDTWNRESQGPIPSPTRPSPVPPSQRAPSGLPAAVGNNLSPFRPRPTPQMTSPRYDEVHAGGVSVTASAVAAAQSPALRLSPVNAVRTPGAASVPPHMISAAAPAHTSGSPMHASPPRIPVIPTSHLMVAFRDPRSPSVTTYADKVALLYMAMIGEKVHADEESFRGLFTKTRVALEPVQISKLFQQADANSDGTLSSGEWERFGEQYPTMVDAMYVRLRDHVTDDEQKKAIEEFKKVLVELEEFCYRDKRVMEEAAREVKNVTEAAKRQAVVVQEARTKERDAKAVLEAARTETERARATVAQRAADVAHAQEAQTRKHQEHLDAQRIVEECQFRVRDLASDAQSAERRLEELKNMVREQIEVLKQAKEREEQGLADLDTRMRESEEAQQGLDDAKNETQLTLDRLCVSEQALTTAQQREEECGVGHIQARDEVNKQFLKQEEDDQEMRVMQEKEASSTARYEESQQILDAKQEDMKLLVDANAAHNLKRDEEEQKEWPMLEQEVRLRQQRIALEEEEAKLRSEHRSFQNTTGRQ